MRRLGSAMLLLITLCMEMFARLDAPGCGTSRDSSAQSMFLHRQTLRRPRALAAGTVAPNDRDIGNIAVMEDSGGLVEKLNQFNLDGSTVTLTPTAANASKYRYATSGQSYDAAAASRGSAIAGL